MILINFSGHPVAGFEVAPLVGVNLDLSSGEVIQEQVRDLLLGLEQVSALKAGVSATIILPGMAPFAAAILSGWHGCFGTFPTIRWALRGPGGFEWPEEATLDLQAARLAARTWRK